MKKFINLVLVLILSSMMVLPSLAFDIPGFKPVGTIKVGTISSKILIGNASSATAPALLAGTGASVGDGEGAAAFITISFDSETPLTAGASYDLEGLTSTTSGVVGISFAAAKGARGGSLTMASNTDSTFTGKVKVLKVTGSNVTVSVTATVDNLTKIVVDNDGNSTETTVAGPVKVTAKGTFKVQ